MNPDTALLKPSNVLNSLKGKKIVLCDLESILKGWSKEVNPDLCRLRQEVDVWLERYGRVFSRSRTMANVGCFAFTVPWAIANC